MIPENVDLARLLETLLQRVESITGIVPVAHLPTGFTVGDVFVGTSRLPPCLVAKRNGLQDPLTYTDWHVPYTAAAKLASWVAQQVASDLVRPGRAFRHCKGAQYNVVCIAADANDHAPMVVYRAVADSKTWVRSLANFIEYSMPHGAWRFFPTDRLP